VGHPTKIGKYEILAELGHGGMGVVYKALDRQLDRLVAIKMIIGATPELLKRFNVEARSTASLQHPNIVTIHDFGEQAGSPYLVMEFLEGMSLDTLIKSGKPLSLVTKLNICVEICNGLHYAHERGIIHRDVKPANVMVLDGSVKIVDFGIARIGDTGISRTELVGSLNFMSPEQFQGEVLDRRVDIWATGVLLYQLLTGALPFPGPDDAATMYKILHEDPPPLGSYLQTYPPGIDQIIARALSKKRDARYFTAHDFAFDMLVILDEEKDVEVSQWLKRAEIAVQKTEWTKAEDYLKQLLRIDKHHTQAHHLLSKVQVQIRSQRQLEQARQLRIQADGAFLERRYDEALALIEQALLLDKTNADVASFRESIREAKARDAAFKAAIRQAEEAQHAGDLDEAKLAVQRAIEIDPHETSAKALQAAILREVEEHEHSKILRTLLDRGREQINARDLTGALATLKQAESIDPASAELFSLLKILHAAREELVRKAEVEKLTQQIEASLSREDYASAVGIASAGLKRYPQDRGLLQFKSFAETQHRRTQLKAYAKEQFLAARKLLDEGRDVDALVLIENALKSVPNDFELETLRNLAKSHLATEQKQQRKRQSIQSIQDLTAAEKFDEALSILQALRMDFPESDELLGLQRSVEVARERKQSAAWEARKQAEESNLLRSRDIAELRGLTRTIQAERDPSKLREFTRRIGDLKNKYLQDSEVQSSVSQATRILDARIASVRQPVTSAQQSATKLFGEPATETPKVSLPSAEEEFAASRKAMPERRTPDLSDSSERTPWSGSRVALVAGFAAAVLVVGSFVVRKALSSSSAYPVRIATIPAGATVTAGGKTCSDPNCQLQFREGNYTAEAHLEGYQPASQAFSVSPGQKNFTVTLALKPLDRAPNSSSDTTADAVSAPATTAAVTAPAGAPASPSIVLAPQPVPVKGTLKVMALLAGGSAGSSLVSGADVVVDGKYYGETGSDGTLSVPLQPGHYTVALRKQGYSAVADKSIDVRQGEQSKLQFGLQPIPPLTQATKAPESRGAVSTGTPSLTAKPSSPPHTTATPVQIAAAARAPASAASNASSVPNATLGGRPSSTASGTSSQPTVNATSSPPPTRTPADTSGGPSLFVSDRKAIAMALEQYKEAYESESMDELLKIWPSITKDQKKALKAGFQSAQAIRVSLSCGDPTILADAATVKCNQEVKYTRAGKVEPPQTVSVDIILKRKQNVWQVGAVRAN
jgi:tetratricopeptide (TPR) repeat protein